MTPKCNMLSVNFQMHNMRLQIPSPKRTKAALPDPLRKRDGRGQWPTDNHQRQHGTM